MCETKFYCHSRYIETKSAEKSRKKVKLWLVAADKHAQETHTMSTCIMITLSYMKNTYIETYIEEP